jgi:hypothetical protein
MLMILLGRAKLNPLHACRQPRSKPSCCWYVVNIQGSGWLKPQLKAAFEDCPEGLTGREEMAELTHFVSGSRTCFARADANLGLTAAPESHAFDLTDKHLAS